MAQLRLNKTELKAQKTLLEQLTKYLPTLQLKKQQLQVEVEAVSGVMEALKTRLDDAKKQMSAWAELISEEILSFAELTGVITEKDNIAGVDVPVFIKAEFRDKKYSFITTPVWFDRVIKELRMLASIREELAVAKDKKRLLAEELRQTSIKVNLFEKRMIPDCRENIRKIKIFLGDMEIAAICNAKIAKDKLERKEAADTMEDAA